MSKPEILIVGPMHAGAIERLDAEFITHKYWLAEDKDALVAKVAANIRGIATTGNHGATAKLIDALPKLEIISCFGVGYDAVDIDAAKRRKIPVSNTPDVLNDCVADLAICMMLDIGRKITQGDRYVRAGKWLKGPQALATRVSGKRLGILGYGRIGRAIAIELAKTHQVVGTYRGRLDAAQSLADETGADIFQCDIASREDRQALLDFTRKEFGRLDLLINNAGMAQRERNDILGATEESLPA